MSYFDKLPIISYNGVTARNITSRVKLSDRTRANATTFYPYTMRDGDRADILSYKYYDNADYAWLIWLTNKVVDPYSDLHISDDDFNNLILNQYGSIENANRIVKFFRNNWDGDEDRLIPSQFDALPNNWKKYYDPVLYNNYSISHYVRKRKDWTFNTNRIMTFLAVEIDPQYIANYQFKVGERIYDQGNPNNYFTFESISFNAADFTATITGKHVIGQWTTSPDSALNLDSNSSPYTDPSFNRGVVGADSGVTIYLNNSTILKQVIPSNEYKFWAPVSMYQYLMEDNDRKKEIYLVDNRYASSIENELKNLLSS